MPVSVYRDRAFPGQGTYIVKAMQVVGMRVGQQYRVQTGNVRHEGL
jgi:hypothetical protein